ncbi:MAG: hypothetical protein K6G15_00415 [Desulfovibrio sp.]|nr:hypothetical protein [Desulfovibrio sp.]
MACRKLGLESPALAWLEDQRLPDTLSEEAYEQTSQDLRARLKAGMAYAQSVFGQVESSLERQLLQAGHSPVSRERIKKPVDWVMLYVSCDFAAAARVLACAVLPRLCAVRDVFAVFSGPRPARAALVSLELAGVQDLFSLKEEQTCDCLKMLAGSGRLLNLGHSLPKALADNPHLCLNEISPPPIGNLDPDCFSQELLSFMHASPPQKAEPSQKLSEYRALFVSERRAKDLVANDELCDCLLLTPGSEGCWRYPNLNRSVFVNETERIAC